ncbi:cyclic pyranopterin monophosphate synthase subunit MoaA [Desulfuromusa kysingii]|uniref:GTP 3',8-cyclase n=1 Tax=Desulfuromusa kysingii TaxID=37625 RepID=A0A1H4DQM6_9BACT|nr:GTP 3',8-cyclase MoaA [Desulfuromusa kysingii]SEA75073.1 cyclic pyranopterin monophosphate synthase subunit MoaA [Desulfuromusa kysingii]
MQDLHGRNINYLRLSITDRCNLRCRYCMPADGVPQTDCDGILRFEDFLQIVRAATHLGIRKVRITGGEPLVRKGVIDFLGKLSSIPGIEEVALTTNGILLADNANALKDAGIKRLNISLDSLNPKTFTEITRGGSLEAVLKGIAAAEKAGLKIKLNMVVMRGVNDHEVLSFAAMSINNPWSVRYIEYMPTIQESDWRSRIVSGAEILTQLQEKHTLEPLGHSRYCGPAKPYRIAGAKGSIGIITPMSSHFCSSCNRIRVDSMGWAKSCLLSDDRLDLKPYLELPQPHLIGALQQVIENKQLEHHLGCEQDVMTPFSMSSIGG